ncbi:MAG: SPOR domain-containing protein [Candidatus Sumerlaeia bacterium]
MKLTIKTTCCLIILLLASSLFAQDAEILFSDTFSGVSGRPAGWSFDTSDRSYWVVQNGWLYTGNGDDLVTQDNYSFALIGASEGMSASDVILRCRFYMTQANGGVVLVGRWQDRENYVRCELSVIENVVAMKLVSISNGNEQEIASQVINTAAMNLPSIVQGSPESSLELAMAFEGSFVSGWLNGQKIAQGRDPAMQQGMMGLGQRLNEVYFKDVIISKISEADLSNIDTIYHVIVGTNMSQSAADNMVQSLNEEGLGPAMIRKSGEELRVLQGNYLSREDAEAGKSRLDSAGMSPGEIVSENIGQSAASAIPAEGNAFMVQLAQARDVSDARSLVTSLRQQGYFPTMVQDGDYFKVFVGRFADRSDALKMRARMAAEGFSFAKIVSESELGKAVPTPPQAQTQQRELPGSVLESDAWQNLTQAEKEEVARLVAMQRASRVQMQSMQEIMELKKMVNELGENQKKIFMTISETEDREEKRQRDIRTLINRIDRAQDEQNYEGALELLDQLEELDPASPLPSIKRQSIMHMQQGTFPGSEALKERERREINNLMARAKDLSNSDDLEDLRQAQNIYTGILAREPDEETRQEALSQVNSLSNAIEKLTSLQQERQIQQTKQNNMIMWGALGGVLVIFILAIIFIYSAGRRRYARMLRQMQDEAIAPLQELREKTQMLSAGGGAAAGAGIAYGQDREMIEQSDSSESEFMIPEADTNTAPPSPASPTRESDESTDLGEDDFMMDFDAESKSEPEPQKAETEDEDSEDLVFSFDEGDESENLAEETGPAITAAEVLEQEDKNEQDEDIVFSFDDGMTDSPISETSEDDVTASEETLPLDDLELDEQVEADSSEKEDSVYDSIPLDDFSFDSDEDTLGGSKETESPFDDSLETTPAEPAPPVPAPVEPTPAEPTPVEPTHVENATTGAAGLSQSFQAGSAGQMPKGWNGENTDYASLQIVDTPDGEGQCLMFKKTEGAGPTSFNRKFDALSGKIQIEFDIRCDEKNKHLLGLYVEKDGDFRRSVHTVVQSVDPKSPAHLRVFTRPTDYRLGKWAHVKYMVDLDEGMVDGYVNDKLVAEGVRMGTRTDSLNTISIRDNSETTGTLYVNNLEIKSA